MTLVYVAVGLLAVLLTVALAGARRAAREQLLTSDHEIAKAARDGRWNQALRSYRAIHGVGLKAAKRAVSGLVRNDAPEMNPDVIQGRKD